jgi:muramidase (phage lysozyme)
MDPMGTSFVTGKNPYTGEKLLTPDDDRIKQAQREHQEKINAERMSSYKSRAGVGRDTSPTREEDSGKKKLLDFIGQKESGSLGYNALVYGNGTPKTADLTGMTLEEVLNYQSGMISRGHASTAVGRYQFTKATLQEFAKKAGVNLSEKFTPEIQDKIAGALLDEVGYEKVIAGKMTMDEFQNRLAGRWASLPRVDNTSQYAGLNGNKVLTSSDTLKNVITASMTASTGSTLASASTTSSDLKMAAATQTTSAPVTIATTNSVNNSQAIVANKAQVNDNSIQAILAII